MQLGQYIKNPGLLSRDTLYELRSYVALHPYQQTARLLLLHNLYLLHDSSFDEELRQAAFYITDRSVLFDLVEAKHRTLARKEKKVEPVADTDRTGTLISNFLESVPEEEPLIPTVKGRRPTAADATVDYVAYLMQVMDEEGESTSEDSSNSTTSLIDNFLENEGRITLSDETPVDGYQPHNEVMLENDRDELDTDYHTEALAKIYIKQGKYTEALAIIKRINEENPAKSAYFADQMRFLEKIILIKTK